MMAEGQYAPRTFKSLISQQLVPTICAECDISMQDWEHISDRVLLEKIEQRLKPKNSTDVINRLRELSISRDTSKGTLSQRYRLFAEAFLQRLAEAVECGCTLSDTAVKSTFTRAVKQEPALESWVTEEKWTSVWDAHRRIVERLREYDAWAVYENMQRNPTQYHVHTPATDGPAATPPSNKPEAGNKRSWDGSKTHQSFVHALTSMMKKMQEGTTNYHAGGQPPRGDTRPSNAPDHRPHHPPRDPSYDYVHPGLDARGLNWHKHTDTIKCREQPCTALFCQICGYHGHTAPTCSKRTKQIPGLNFHGYYQESKPNCPAVSMPSEMRQHRFGAPPRANTTHTPDDQTSAFPHFVNSTTPRSNTAPRSGTPHPERQSRVNQSNQTHEGDGGSPPDRTGSARDKQ
jgi:hypothetical protein